VDHNSAGEIFALVLLSHVSHFSRVYRLPLVCSALTNMSNRLQQRIVSVLMLVTSVIGPGKVPFLTFLLTTVVSPITALDLGTLRVIGYLMQVAIVLIAVVPHLPKVMGKFVILVTGNAKGHYLHFHLPHPLREMDDRRTLRQGRIGSVRQLGVKGVPKTALGLPDASSLRSPTLREPLQPLNWIMNGGQRCAQMP
jgi:hypothetical protein